MVLLCNVCIRWRYEDHDQTRERCRFSQLSDNRTKTNPVLYHTCTDIHVPAPESWSETEDNDASVPHSAKPGVTTTFSLIHPFLVSFIHSLSLTRLVQVEPKVNLQSSSHPFCMFLVVGGSRRTKHRQGRTCKLHIESLQWDLNPGPFLLHITPTFFRVLDP